MEHYIDDDMPVLTDDTYNTEPQLRPCEQRWRMAEFERRLAIHLQSASLLLQVWARLAAARANGDDEAYLDTYGMIDWETVEHIKAIAERDRRRAMGAMWRIQQHIGGYDAANWAHYRSIMANTPPLRKPIIEDLAKLRAVPYLQTPETGDYTFVA